MLDQHFIIDKELIKRIVSYASLNKNDIVLEIGSGTGNLTQELCKKCKVIAVEIDSVLVKTLKDKKLKNVEVIEGNILKLINKLKFNKIVSNLPYNICEPLLNKLLNINFELAIFTVPYKFASRLTKEKSLLSILMPIFFIIAILEEVNKEAFEPMPRVSSNVIKIIPKKLSKKELLIKEIYLQNDKKLKNATRDSFKKIFELNKFDATKKIPNFSFNNKLVYQLNYEEWKEVIKNL